VDQIQPDRQENPGARAAQAATPPVSHGRAAEAVIGLIATPVAAIAGGAALQVFLNLPKFKIQGATDVLAMIAFYGLVGSFFASPTTLFGLPIVSIHLPRSSPSRPLALTAAGFALGWLTMMLWSLLFFGVRFYARLQYAYAAKTLASFCLIGAVCGAVTGLVMGLVTRRHSEAA
jgi:hypothetical protein